MSGREKPRAPLPRLSGIMSLRAGLMGMQGFVTLVTLVVLGISVAYLIHSSEQSAWRGRQQEAAHNAANTVGEVIARTESLLTLVGQLGTAEALRDPEVMHGLLANEPELLELVLVDAKGHIRAGDYRDRQVLASQFTISQSRWFLEGRAGKRYISGVQLSSLGEPYVLLAVPAPDGGIVGARLRMNILWDVIDTIRFGRTGLAYVIDREGMIVAHTQRELVLSGIGMQGRPELAAMLAAPDASWHGEYVNMEGVPVVATTAAVPGVGWLVVTELADQEAYSTSRTTLIVLSAEMIGLSIILMLSSRRYLSRLILKPMEGLRAGSARIGQGDLKHRIAVDRRNEIGQVAEAFNDMAARLLERDEQVTARTVSLAAEVAERKRTEEALSEAQEALERRVAERTAKLAAANLDLQAEITERMAAEAELRAQRQLSENLVAVARAAAELPTLEPTLRNVLQVAATLTGADDGDLLVMAEDGSVDWNIVMAGRHISMWRRDLVARIVDHGLGGWVMRHQVPGLILDTLTDPRWLTMPEQPFRARSALSVPIKTGPTLVGVLTLAHPEPEHFGAEHLRLMQAAADQMALAVRNAQMYEAQHRAAERQTVLYQVLRAASGKLDPEAVARLAVHAIDEFTGWPHICLALPDDSGSRWVVHAASGVLGAEVGTSGAMSEGVIGRAFSTAHTQIVPDVCADPDYRSTRTDLCSELAVPIRRGEVTIGVLNLESDRPAAFGAADVQTAELLSDAIGLGLENARLFETAQRELSERQRAEEQARASLREKEILLREIHHRVKNNLQVVSSLLNLQARRIHDPQSLAMLRDSQDRIRSIALIHEKLYRAPDLARIDFGDYVRHLAQHLAHSHRIDPESIALSIHVPDELRLGVDVAIPCGLIINELVSNAFQHAFPDGRAGEIRIDLSREPDDRMVLAVADDGVGLPPDLDMHSLESLGLHLVAELTGELQGTMTVERGGGATFRIAFGIPPG